MLLIRHNHIEQIGTIGRNHAINSRHEILLAFRPFGRHAKTLCNRHIIGKNRVTRRNIHIFMRLCRFRIANKRMPAIALVKAILPLHHHTQVLIVENHRLNRNFLRIKRRQLLHIHRETAIPIDIDNQRVGKRQLRPQRSGQTKTHRPQTARREPTARLIKRIKLRRPHLVLPHPCGNNRLPLRHLIERLNRILRQNDIFDILVIEGILLPPCFNLITPGLIIARYNNTV